jgi:hypothetical protein
LRYKEEGLKIFDFGGWYQGPDPDMLKINEFKRGFGGQVLHEFECEQTLTLKGKVVLAVAAVLDKVKGVSPVSRPTSSNHAPESDTHETDSDRTETSPAAAESSAHSQKLNA